MDGRAWEQLRPWLTARVELPVGPLFCVNNGPTRSNLGITSVYLQGIDNAEIIQTVHARRAPMVPASTRFHF
jgi:hypothetical protein